MKLRLVRVAVILLATGAPSWTAAQPISTQPTATQSPAPADKPSLPKTTPRPSVSGPVLSPPVELRNIPAGADEKPIIKASLSVTWSANKDAVWAYSDKTGIWARQTLKPKFETIKPLITGKVCILIQDFSYYGYSAETGTWDVLRLTKGKGTIPELNIIGDNFSITTDDNVYSFSVVKGIWSWPDKTGGTRNEPGAKLESGAPNQREPAGDKGTTEADDAELKDVVIRLRAMLHTHGRRHPEVQKLESELRDVLGRIFDRRQQTQRDELALLQERMSTIQKRIEDRANNRKNIIARSVDDHFDASRNSSNEPTNEDSIGPEKPEAVFLPEAVRVFNAQAVQDRIGKEQPPLTVDEVKAALLWALSTPDQLPVSDQTLRKLRGILNGSPLPDGFKLEVLTGYEPNDETSFTVWSVRFRVPRLPEGTYAITVREKMLGARQFGERERAVIRDWREKESKQGVLGSFEQSEYRQARTRAAELDAGDHGANQKSE